jgi:hypothetical protein
MNSTFYEFINLGLKIPAASIRRERKCPRFCGSSRSLPGAFWLQIVPGLPFLVVTYRGRDSQNHFIVQHITPGIPSVHKFGMFIAKIHSALDRAVFFQPKNCQFGRHRGLLCLTYHVYGRVS